MEFVIAHLSDIHIAEASDVVLGRPEILANAIQSAMGASTECLVVCTGDITWSGKKEQFDLATDFFSKIEKQLRAGGRVPTFVFVPGNHDCDFAEDDRVREMLITQLRTDPKSAKEAIVYSHCAKVQEKFRAFVATLPASISTLPFTSELYGYVEYRGMKVQILNTAWMSSLHEASGTLVFPESVLATDLSAFTITCLHHPPHWFTVGTRRELWRVIAQGSDVVLTGHEHEADQTTVESRTDSSLHSHFSAGALQENSKRSESCFSVYSIDTDAKTCRTYQFNWDESEKRYRWAGLSAEQPRPPAEPLPLNRIRSIRQFEFTQKHQAFLNALTMNITHQVVGELKLSDVFVYPDLSSLKTIADPAGIRDNLRGHEVLQLVEAAPLAIITGDSYSGKTALGKTLCAQLHERGYVPIFLRPTKPIRTADGWIEAIEKAFSEQYASALLSRFQQLPTSNRVVIVDDADLAVGDAETFVPILLKLGLYAGHIVLLADAVCIEPKALVRIMQADIPQYQIRPFGYRQRDELVQKWLLMGGGQMDATAFLRKLHETTKTINSIVGKGLVPSYPFFVLTLLHTTDSAVQLETRTSAHGYYFEQLIRKELLRGRQEHAQIDVTLGVLSFIAYQYFVASAERMSDHALREAVRSYEQKYALSLDYSNLLAHLVERRMLTKEGTDFVFSYDHVYYFFVARYFARNIDQPAVKESVSELCRSTARKKYGDILLFLAHFSNDPFVISEMVKGANEAFFGEPEIDLKKDLAIVGELHDVIDGTTFEDGSDALAHRQELLARRDQVDESAGPPSVLTDESGGPPSVVTNELELINRLIAAIRNMEVVGQVLKNNPGHLDADRKSEIAQAAYRVGARLWRWFLHLLAQDQRNLVELLLKEARRDDPGMSSEELKATVGGALLGLVRFGSLGLVKRIAASIGAPELDVTYKELVKVIGGDAPHLVHLSIRLDCMPGSQEGELRRIVKETSNNPLVIWIMKQLVMEHLHLFQLDTSEKQKMCAAVGIRFESGLGTGQRQKRLPRGS